MMGMVLVVIVVVFIIVMDMVLVVIMIHGGIHHRDGYGPSGDCCGGYHHGG